MRILLALCVASLAAQTTLPVQQIRGAQSASGQVFVTLPNGTVAQAALDAELILDTSGPRPVLRIAVPPPVRVLRMKVVANAVATQQSFQLSGTGITATNCLVYRNGFLQSEGDDYTFTAGSGFATVTFLATFSTAIQPGDIVQLVAIL